MHKLALIILDGFGIGKPNSTNAIHVANTPFFDDLWKNYPHTTLQASGLAVGLPKGQIGGSEVGHLTIGAGRVLYQDLVRINRAFDESDNPSYGIKSNKNFQSFIQTAQKEPAHLLGMLSPGGIHSHQKHLFEILKIMHDQGCMEPYIHILSDGRDTLPYSGKEYAQQLTDLINKMKFGIIVGVTGRFYGMDRDHNWDRTQKLLDLMVKGAANKKSRDLVEAFEQNYHEKLTDELQEATKILPQYNGIKKNEPVLFWNFRSDRMKQVISKLHETYPENPFFTMTQYDKDYPYPVFFKKHQLTNTLSEVISRNDIAQLKAAETDKIPHVTYFFNGGVEMVFPKELHAFVESTKVTYDKSPKMRAHEIGQAVIKTHKKHSDLGFAVVNFANADLVSHFGVFESSVKAVECVDQELKRLCAFLTENNFICVITADHGNADEMVDEKTGQPRTAHTMNPVPFVIYDPKHISSHHCHSERDSGSIPLDQRRNNGLSHVARTVLELMEIPSPEEYDESLLLE